MKRVVLLRHGESVWNKENRFTGWTDVDLSETGVKEAIEGGKTLKNNGFIFDKAYTSYLKRAVKTLNQVLDIMDLDWIPVAKSWRLNEKHYGMLQGLNKTETAAKYGEDQVKIWRRSYDIAPAPLEAGDSRNPRTDVRYNSLTDKEIPLTESLLDTVNRAVPYWENVIVPEIKQNNYNQIIIAAHGNSLRAIIKFLKNISDEEIVSLNLPTAVPYVFEFDDNMKPVKDYFLGDPEEIKRKMDAVANQGKK
ncbi:MAG: 2,3-diphosphoglycerate-dependent phosphoglycerate mutase [Prevotellaceae bacterium]|jgi:2,3-bisphosphoglycerate-dependent phosphoglycerate mutase|nr:2,3-diphosphoglycerate-dependent phosphoglycerate mutase [Prevotellaceae bacterium]